MMPQRSLLCWGLDRTFCKHICPPSPMDDKSVTGHQVPPSTVSSSAEKVCLNCFFEHGGRITSV
jgi:hypothetical protein